MGPADAQSYRGRGAQGKMEPRRDIHGWRRRKGRKRMMRRGEHSKGTSVQSRDGAGEQQTWGTGGGGVTREPFGFTGFRPNFPFTVSNSDALSHTTLCRLILESALLCLRGPVYEWQLLHEHLLITLENVSCPVWTQKLLKAKISNINLETQTPEALIPRAADKVSAFLQEAKWTHK